MEKKFEEFITNKWKKALKWFFTMICLFFVCVTSLEQGFYHLDHMVPLIVTEGILVIFNVTLYAQFYLQSKHFTFNHTRILLFGNWILFSILLNLNYYNNFINHSDKTEIQYALLVMDQTIVVVGFFLFPCKFVEMAVFQFLAIVITNSIFWIFTNHHTLGVSLLQKSKFIQIRAESMRFRNVAYCLLF